MKKTLLASIFATVAFCVTAQDFDQAIGLRFGYPNSVTYKKFISESSAIEGIVGFRSWGWGSTFQVAGAYQIHNELELDDFEGLEWYYGAGAGVYFNSVEFGSNTTNLGINGYLGLSYTLEDVPINLSIDWVPTFTLGDFRGDALGLGYGNLAARYVLD